jgi:environmental stress-induced protein Ves
VIELTVLDPASYRRTPWKNGGGVTVDIADEYVAGAEPGGWTGMVWRLGRTRIETPAPFSDLSGNDRILSVIGGRGLVLRPEGEAPLDAREPFRPVRFPGEWAITSELENGPVAVLNLMADRSRVDIGVAFLAASDELPLALGLWVLYAPATATELTIGDRSLALPQDGAVVVRSDAPVHLTHSAGPLAVASIRHRR